MMIFVFLFGNNFLICVLKSALTFCWYIFLFFLLLYLCVVLMIDVMMNFELLI